MPENTPRGDRGVRPRQRPQQAQPRATCSQNPIPSTGPPGWPATGSPGTSRTTRLMPHCPSLDPESAPSDARRAHPRRFPVPAVALVGASIGTFDPRPHRAGDGRFAERGRECSCRLIGHRLGRNTAASVHPCPVPARVARLPDCRAGPSAQDRGVPAWDGCQRRCIRQSPSPIAGAAPSAPARDPVAGTGPGAAPAGADRGGRAG